MFDNKKLCWLVIAMAKNVKGWPCVDYEWSMAISVLQPMMKILIIMDILVLRFYRYIENIGRYFFTNIDGAKIIQNS